MVALTSRFVMSPMLPVPFVLFLLISTSICFLQHNIIKSVCTMNKRPLLESYGQLRTCTNRDSCPMGYECEQSGICCTLSSQCPNGFMPTSNTFESRILCAISGSSNCPSGFICRPSSNGVEKLCCRADPLQQHSYIVLSYPILLAENECSSNCTSAAIDERDSCCIQRHRRPVKNSCPSGWSLSNGVVTLCDPSKQNECDRTSSCLRSALPMESFVCCVQRTTERDVICTRTQTSPERLPDGRPRMCTPLNRMCSPGYVCEDNNGDTHMACCPKYADEIGFQCVLPMHTPVLVDNSNVLCSTPGQIDECPPGAVCQSAIDSAVFICCFQTKQRSTQPQCPINSVPQYNAIGVVHCDINISTQQCKPGYACTRSANFFSRSICCSVQSSSSALICPGQQKLLMEGASPHYCTPNEQVPCPAGYSCNEAINRPDTFVCCTSPTTRECPPNFAPTLNSAGQEIYCTPNEPSICPGYSMCLQSQILADTFLCCKSTSVPHVCPNNQRALLLPNGQVEICEGSSSSCSQSGYTCQLSSALATWVCCSQRSEMALCADGRETYFDIEGQTFSCQPLAQPTGCPNHFDCSRSNMAGTFVCCQQATVSITTTTVVPITVAIGCPIGWNPFRSEIDGSYRFCENSFDMNCPIGFSCTQSNKSGIYVCCRLASTVRCANGLNTLLVNNQPKLCYGTQQNACPSGYSCKSSTKSGIYVCCSDYIAFEQLHVDILKEIRCLSDDSMPAIQDESVLYCIETNRSSSCPHGHICSSSTVDGLNVCCRQSTGLKIQALELSSDKACGSFGVVYRRNGRALECTDDTNICPEPFECQPSLTNTRMYCCEEAKCPSGLTSLIGRHCHSSDDCPQDYECLQSINAKDVYICCAAASAQEIRCLKGKTQISDGIALSCMEDSSCKEGYTCSAQTTTGENACCEIQHRRTRICPHNRQPYRSPTNGRLKFCGEMQTSCPDGYFCKRTLDSRHQVCCSPIAFCPLRSVPLIDPETNHAKMCSLEGSAGGANPDDCPSGYTCRQSSVSFVKVCCRNSLSGDHSNEYEQLADNDNSRWNVFDDSSK